ncbi:putative bifunctional diguanylate cyclase/phosphodiesterase [Cellulomonas endophytica]|uniref:putative bifunctional diguanylate cyclase/phosphodiesterase n=1 Tax=Cellulomonas endophytica TaxID=2494735 RepID=UPI0010107F57|nr:sensor domain-containing phosphodiesterase [Cellulomonas endophytica]
MTGRESLVHVLDEFSSVVVEDFDAPEVLRRLMTSVLRVVEVDAAGVMLALPDGVVRHVFASHDLSQRLERLQEEMQDGPCRSAVEERAVVDLADVRAEGRWPGWMEAAADLGVRGLTSVPLVARGRTWGVLDLYRREARRLTEDESHLVQQLARLAVSYLVVAADRDAAREAREELAHRAAHDPLTELPLRWVLHEHLERAVARLGRSGGTAALLFLDVDGLKAVNDSWGHLAGDELLRACARRVRGRLRSADVLARIGGDELVVLLEDLHGPGEALDVAERVAAALREPLDLGDVVLQPSASIGVAYLDAEQTADSLLSHADAAMYVAKRAGRGRIEVFVGSGPAPHGAGPWSGDHDRASDALAADLRGALAAGQLRLHYQPIRELLPAALVAGAPRVDDLWAMEALLRWHHPSHGVLAAGQFVDLAAELGLLVEIGSWVVEEACRQLAAWDAELGALAPPRVFVNVSAEELARPGLIEDVARAMATQGLGPDRLTLEITESGLLDEGATRAIAELEALRCGLAIDDLGAGWSSLSRVLDLPRATLKIDRSLSLGLATRSEAAAVVSAVLLLGRTLGTTVVLEGIEDAETLAAAARLGCTHVQGYHLGRPQPPEELSRTLLEEAARR